MRGGYQVGVEVRSLGHQPGLEPEPRDVPEVGLEPRRVGEHHDVDEHGEEVIRARRSVPGGHVQEVVDDAARVEHAHELVSWSLEVVHLDELVAGQRQGRLDAKALRDVQVLRSDERSQRGDASPEDVVQRAFLVHDREYVRIQLRAQVFLEPLSRRLELLLGRAPPGGVPSESSLGVAKEGLDPSAVLIRVPLRVPRHLSIAERRYESLRGLEEGRSAGVRRSGRHGEGRRIKQVSSGSPHLDGLHELRCAGVPHLLEEVLERERHPLFAVRHGCRTALSGRPARPNVLDVDAYFSSKTDRTPRGVTMRVNLNRRVWTASVFRLRNYDVRHYAGGLMDDAPARRVDTHVWEYD